MINFVLSNEETFKNQRKDGIAASGSVTPRMLDKFLSLVSTIDDFSSNLNLVRQFGEANIGSTATAMFVKFVANKLDLLPTPKDLLEMPAEKGLSTLSTLCGSIKKGSTDFKSATASIIALRLANYVTFNKIDCSVSKKEKSEGQKLTGFIESDCFSEDQKFMMMKKIARVDAKLNGQLLAMMLANPKVSRMLMS